MKLSNQKREESQQSQRKIPDIFKSDTGLTKQELKEYYLFISLKYT